MDEIFTTKKGIRIMSNKMILAVFAMFMFFACNNTEQIFMNEWNQLVSLHQVRIMN